MTWLLLQCVLLVTLVSTYYSARAYDIVPKARSAMAPQYGAFNDDSQQSSGLISSMGLNQKPSFPSRPIITYGASNGMTFDQKPSFPSRPINTYGASNGMTFDQKRPVQTSPIMGYGTSSGLSRDQQSSTQFRPSFDYGMSSSMFDQKPAIQQQGPSPCSPATIGQLLPNPADRSSYITCIDATHYEIMACPDQLVFNDALDRCERISDDEAVCKQNPCMNGGQCYATSSQTFKCTCLESFTGERCEVPTSTCARQPCGPDAECWSLRAEEYPQDYVCVCSDRQSYGLSCSQTVPNPCVQESNEYTQYHPFGFSKHAYVQCNGEISYFRPCPLGLLWSQEERVCKSPFVQQQPRPQYDSMIPQNSYGPQMSNMGVGSRQQSDLISQLSYPQQPTNTYGDNRGFDIGQQSFDQQRKTHRHNKMQHVEKPRLFNDIKSSLTGNQRQDAYFQKQQSQPVLSSVINTNSYQSQPSSSGYGTSSLLGQNDIVSGRRVSSGLFNNQVQQPQAQVAYRRKRQYSQKNQASSQQAGLPQINQKLPLMDVTSQQYGNQQSYGNQFQQPQIQSLADLSIQQQPLSSGYGSSSPQYQSSSSNMLRTNFQNDRPIMMPSFEQRVSAQIQVTFADQLCQGQQPETVLPHPATTRKFIICLDSAKGVEQDCPSGLHYSTTSARCERKSGHVEAACAMNPCLNGGQCIEDSITLYKCDCPQGLGGKQCELDLRTCLQSPCGQGKCQSFRIGAALTHVCICEGDTYGPTCQQTLPNPCRQDDSLPLGYSDKGFIMCDGNRFFVEGCPGGLIWDINEKACVWPDTLYQGASLKVDVQRPLSDVMQQQGLGSYSSQQYSNQRPSLDLINQRTTGYGQQLLQEPFQKRQQLKQSYSQKQKSFSDMNQQQVPTYQQSYGGSQLQPLADISSKQQQPISSEYGSSTILRQNEMMPSSQLPSSNQFVQQPQSVPQSQQPLSFNSAYGKY